MSVRFVIGRAGTGKTTAMLEEIGERIRKEPFGHPLIFLVPEQATFQAEVTLARMPGLEGSMRAQVLSFGRLGYRVLQEVGGLARLPVDELGKQMVLRLVVERLRDQLAAFAGVTGQAGFVTQLAEMISECKRYNVYPELLKELEWNDRTLERKLHDLSLVWNEYHRYLADLYYDSDDLLSWVAEKIQQSASMANAEIWVDGFSGFTKQEYEILKSLMRTSKRVTIALCGDPAELSQPIDELSLFYPTMTTYDRLRRIAYENGVTEEVPLTLNQVHRFQGSPWLSHIESHHFAWGKPTGQPLPNRTDEIQLVAAPNPSIEVHHAALQILKWVKEEDYRFRDIAVLVREVGLYADEIASVFREYGIPFFLDEKKTILHHPAVELVRAALDTAASNFRSDSVIRCLKTDLMHPLDVQLQTARFETDLLENYTLAYGIYGSLWLQEQEWGFHRFSGDEELLQRYASIEEIRRRYTAHLKEFALRLQRAEERNVREMCTEIYRFLERMQIPEKLQRLEEQSLQEGDIASAQEHGQVWQHLMALLDQLVKVLGREQMEIGVFSRLLDSGLESVRLGLVPPSLDQVVICSMERSRAPETKAVLLLGANEGILPLIPKGQGLLDENERERFLSAGIELAPTHRQRLMSEQFLLYQALTRPSERLIISCALSDLEGKSLHPSPVFDQLKQTLPDLSVRLFLNEPTGDAKQDVFLFGSKRIVFSHLLMLFRKLKQGGTVPDFWWEVYDWFLTQSKEADRERQLLQGLTYTNQARTLEGLTILRLYGRELGMSVSRLERFQACPFAHYAAHGLKLAERDRFVLERFDVGELFHASLKRAAERIFERKLDWGALTEQESLTLANEAVEELIPETRSSILNRTARYRYLTGHLKRTVGRALSILGEHAKHSRFSPVGFEVSFGPNGDLPGLSLHLANGIRLNLRGRIDRVDRAVDGEKAYLRVIDYKSGARQLALADIWNGLNLQLLLYLDIVMENSEKWLGHTAEIGGVFYYQVADPYISAKRALPPEEVGQARKNRLKMKGLMLADADVALQMDSGVQNGTSSSLLPFGFKKDGTFNRYSSVASKEEFNLLRNFVRKTVSDTGEKIATGDISISPYSQGDFVACQTCSFQSVCQFDPSFEGNQLRNLPEPKDDEVWRRIREVLQHDTGRENG